MAAQDWAFAEFAGPHGVEEAITFLNEAPRQGPGEASATLREDGSVGLFYLWPGSLGSQESPLWASAEFVSQGAQQTTDFLNLAPTQRAGEASVTLRDDDSAGMLYLSPGAGTTQTWQAAELPAPLGFEEAVLILDWFTRQGAGEACMTPHRDGSAGLLILDPGSLGASTGQAWVIQQFPASPGAQEAVDRLNTPPRQGPGEAIGFTLSDGAALLMLLEPGTG